MSKKRESFNAKIDIAKRMANAGEVTVALNIIKPDLIDMCGHMKIADIKKVAESLLETTIDYKRFWRYYKKEIEPELSIDVPPPKPPKPKQKSTTISSGAVDAKNSPKSRFIKNN